MFISLITDIDCDYLVLISVKMEDHGVIEIEDQDEEEFEYEEEEEAEEEEEEDEDDAYEEDELIPAVVASPRVSNLVSRSGNSQEAVVFHVDLVDNPTDMNSCQKKMASQENGGDGGDVEEELDGGEIEGLFCPICMDAWTSGGSHQICCLPCGHIYGLSCIKKWLRQRRSSGKCPQCNRICTLKDVRVLYAGRLCVVDAELQKQVRSLEAKCASLEQKNFECCKREVKAQEREADLHLKVQQLTEKTKYLERLLGCRQRESLGSSIINQGYQRRVINGHGIDSGSGSQACSGIFTLQGEFHLEGGRYFDVDASGQLMIVARRLNGMGGTNLLTKISLIAPSEREDIQLPANSKAVRAVCVRPCSRLALLAFLGKKLSVVSTESNNTILTYDLPAPGWSCSWDINSSHYVYTGLQNGMVLAFDMRQTRTPLESRTGLSCNPVHTVISVSPDSLLSSGTRTLLTASQIGMCEWNIGTGEERPYLIPESEKQGVCISLAHSGGDDIVASFRPKIEMATDMLVSPTPSTSSIGVEGCHIFYKRSGARSYQKTGSLRAQVDSIRLPKSSIINKQNPMFVYPNELTSDLIVHDVSNLTVVQRLKTPKTQHILDVKCTEIRNACVLGCLSGDIVQLYT